VVITFLIARVLYDRRTALYAALFLAISSYSVALGRLALLDATFAFLFTLSILFLAAWGRSGRAAWFGGFAATAALAIQAKVVGVLLFAVCGGYLLLSRSVGRLNRRSVLLGVVVFVVFFAPALLQLARNSQEFTEFLSSSSERVSSVPWHYYLTTLTRYEGPAVTICWALSVVAALGRRSRADLLPIIWIVVIAGFYQLYPLKAFNYLLPLVPALSLLMGRVASSLTAALQRILVARRASADSLSGGGAHPSRSTVQLQPGTGPRGERARLRRIRARAMLISRLVFAAVLVAGTALPLRATLQDDSFAGLKEAAQWLAGHSQPDAGVMTISHGSSQYVFAFYANRDSYPFGRFRLATVLPGGVVVNSSPTADGSTPRDWVVTWPPRLVESGAVSYLVYYTGPVDDPPEESQLVETATQRKFRQFVESYGGELVHTVYRNHEGRVWIYRVTKRLPKPVLAYSIRRGVVKLTGRGFTEDAPVTVYYHQRPVARTRANGNGSVSVRFLLPKKIRSEYFLVASDSAGNSTSLTQLHPHQRSE
jgi:Dolichyl-phosphate-mannose-protein mannosyltransferase